MKKGEKGTIGSSHRTYGKHVLLNKILGREAGVMRNFSTNMIKMGMIKRYSILDLCAGDGKPTPLSEDSSPLIMRRHKKFLDDHGVPNSLMLFEKNEHTYSILKKEFLKLC